MKRSTFLALLIAALAYAGAILINHPPQGGYKPDSISNPDNAEFVVEVAFNLDITPSEVTQEQFEHRY